MNSRTSLPSLLIALALLGTSAHVAPAALVDYTGFAFETGGILPSNPGDQLTVVAVALDVDPLFGANLPSSEVTLVLSGLVSTGQFDMNGTTIVSFVGGTLEMYEDPSNDRDWGILPPNATAPASFSNGSLLFSGSFNTFTLFIAPNGAGAYEGSLDGTGGSALASACSDCAYSFAGTFAASTGAQIPEGYDLQIDGTLEVDSGVSVAAPSSWGAVKNVFRD